MGNVCKQCNTTFEGNICPNCGAVPEEALQESPVTIDDVTIPETNETDSLDEDTKASPQQDSKTVAESNVAEDINSVKTSDQTLEETTQQSPLEYNYNSVPATPQKPSFDIKKNWRLILEGIGGIAILILLITTLGRVPKSSYQELEANYAKQSSELEETQNSLADATKTYDDYKKKMKPFEEMTAAQAEAEKIKAEQVAADKKAAEEQAAAEKKAAEEQAAAEAAAAKAAEEAKGYETGISYDQLARTPDEYKGNKVKFYGKVIQVIEGTGTVQIRLAVDDDYDKVLLGEYASSVVSSRVLDDDHITIYGTSSGTISYKSTMGGTITIPGISVEKIDQ